VQNSFFTFPDRSLKYDCPSCGSQCCKGKGLALEARAEVVRFARLEPRLAALLYPMNERFAQVMDVSDGCWMLRPDGLCAIETDRSYAEKPHTCRLFPFNRIFTVGEARVVDFNSKICPLQDVADARSGQSWADLEKQIAGEGAPSSVAARRPRRREERSCPGFRTRASSATPSTRTWASPTTRNSRRCKRRRCWR